MNVWDVATGAYFPQQDWRHKPNEHGTRTSCLEPTRTVEAQRCVAGLTNTKAYYGATLAQHPEPSPLV